MVDEIPSMVDAAQAFAAENLSADRANRAGEFAGFVAAQAAAARAALGVSDGNTTGDDSPATG